MMRISDRFIDNGVVGGFFLAGQIILLALWGLTGWIKTVTDFLIVSAPLQPTVNALLAALGIIGIFFFGLLLDLFTTVFPPFVQEEIVTLKWHLDCNQDWLKETIGKEDTYFHKGYQDFTDSYCLFSKERRCNKNLYIRLFHLLIKQLHPSNESDNALKEEENLVAYYRLRYFFISYVLLNSGIPQLDSLTDQVHWWRASRAICVATVIWAFEPPTVLVGAVFIQQRLPDMVVPLVISWFVLLILSSLTFKTTTTAFARMCHTLFSLTRIIYIKKESDHSPSEQQNSHTQ